MSNNRFDLQKQPEALGSSQLLYVTTSRFDTDWHSTLHTHACTELFYCVRGIGEFVIENERRAVGGDDMVIVNANVKHTESSYSSNPLEYIVLGVDGLDFRFGEDSAAFRVINCRDNQEEIRFSLELMLREAQRKEGHYELVCQHLLQVLFIQLMRYHAIDISVLPKQRGSQECAAVRRHIDERYYEALTLNDLAEIAHVNKYHLVHAFRKEYGITPINYLIERRIREGKYLLENTDHSLTHISQILGFSSPSYFSQSFRKLTDQSPMEYRKAARTRQGG